MDHPPFCARYRGPMTSPLSPRVTWAVFDLDGTVWDSAPGILNCLHRTLDDLGLPSPDESVLASMLGPPLLTALSELGVPDTDLDRARTIYRTHYRATGEHDCTPYVGVVGLLDRLRAAGLRLATATSKGVEPTRRMLDHFGLTDRFDAIAAASMTATGHGKADIIGEALTCLASIDPTGSIDDAVMIGDRVFDIDGGHQVGVRTIGVEWGYAAPGELVAAAPTAIAASITELESLVIGRPARFVLRE